MTRSVVRIHYCPLGNHKIDDRGVEQLAARQAHNLEVAGSTPAPATNNPSIGGKPIERGRGSSVVEHATENRSVMSPILTLGTRVLSSGIFFLLQL